MDANFDPSIDSAKLDPSKTDVNNIHPDNLITGALILIELTNTLPVFDDPEKQKEKAIAFLDLSSRRYSAQEVVSLLQSEVSNQPIITPD